jgi:hypothetical protein
MAEGPPTPFAAHKRPQLNWNSSVYPLSEEAQLHAWGQLVEYLARGILQVVDPDTPCIEHPVFVVEKYKFAPGLPQLIRLYSQLDGSLATHIAKSAFEAVTDALTRQRVTSATSVITQMSPSALNDAFNRFRSPPPKLRLVVDYDKALNDSLADWAFRYVGLDAMLARVRPGMWIASFDISAAFLLIPIAPCDQPQFAVRWPSSGRMKTNGTLYPGDTWLKFFQSRHLFGSKHRLLTSYILTRRALKYCGPGAVTFEFRRRPTFDAYMDDLFIMATTKPICEKAFNDAQELLRYINVLWNDKDSPTGPDFNTNAGG